MSAQDNTEKVLRQLHLLIARAESYSEDSRYVLVDKREMQKIFNDLNTSVAELMEEYQLTREDRENTSREAKKQGDRIIADSKSRAEDVYAASVLYSNEALSEVWKIVHASAQSMADIYADMERRLLAQERKVRKNQSELRSHLRNMEDTDKYMRLIEEENLRLEQERRERDRMIREDDSLQTAAEPVISINTDILKKLGMSENSVLSPEDYGVTVGPDQGEELPKAAQEAEESVKTADEESISEDANTLPAAAEEIAEDMNIISEDMENVSEDVNVHPADEMAQASVNDQELSSELVVEEKSVEGIQEIAGESDPVEDMEELLTAALDELDDLSAEDDISTDWDELLESNSRTLDNTADIMERNPDEDLVTIDLEDQEEKWKESKPAKKKKNMFSFHKK